MAGSNVYIGKMIADLQLKIDQLVTKTDANVAALTAISNNSVQAINSIKTKPSDNKIIDVFAAEKTVSAGSSANSTSFVAAGSVINNLATGAVRIKSTNVLITTTNGSSVDHIVCAAVRIGTTIYEISGRALYNATPQLKSGFCDIPIKIGDIIEIGTKVIAASNGVNNGTVKFPVNSVSINYDLLNIVTESPFLVI